MARLGRKNIIGWLLVCALAGVLAAQTATEAPLPIPRDAAGKVTPVGDFAGVIDDATEQRLADILKNLADKQGIEFAVVTVNTTDGRDVFDYSLALMRGWGVGTEEKQGQTARPGLLMLVAIQDRKYFTQVSRHLEGDLPDGLVSQIQRTYLVPLLKQGRYSEAVFSAAQAFVGEMARKRGFTVEGLDQKYVRQRPAAPPRRSSGLTLGRVCGCLVVLVIVLIILYLISRRSGGTGSSGWGGGGFGGDDRYQSRGGGGFFPVPIVIGGGGWGGDSGGSDWGSGGDWGGFSGGGGDAGGGGAGGDW
jgi:uncharacterized protein